MNYMILQKAQLCRQMMHKGQGSWLSSFPQDEIKVSQADLVFRFPDICDIPEASGQVFAERKIVEQI